MSHHAGLIQVTAPMEENPTECIRYTTKVDIEQACPTEAKWRFTQANDTPMLQQSMINILGIDNMDSPAFKQILVGTFQCPAECNKYVHKLIKNLKRPQELPPITMRTYDKYKWSWELAWETTASSPSKVHFRHYITGIMKDMIGKLNAILANVQLLSGMAPEQWKQTLNVMLKKLAGNDNVEKLRIIMLFKADFNNNNKWLGWVTMQLAEKNNLLTPEQYGSQKNKAAITQCLNKHLFYDYIKAMRIPAALCSNDAKSCFNQLCYS